ncbi:VPA1262 family protein [Natranaerobius thermophilus]|uniref:VPA1262 family protein n=1 Tax=Natranaerobius thermophilus TaxID=375929 RepID=UPI0011D0ABF3|nr:VPA1262 family protein [Natranaerobius thermophilus]
MKDSELFSVYIISLVEHVNGYSKLLYGLGYPINGEVPKDKLFNYTISNNGPGKLQVNRLTCFLTGDKLKIFLDKMEEGKNLQTIAGELEIELDKKLTEELKGLHLKTKDYRHRPPVFLENKESVNYYKLEPIASLASNPVICESIINIEKEKVIDFDDGGYEQYDVMEFIKDTLKEEFSFKIPGPDIKRLGNFEVFSYPFVSSKDVKPLTTKVIKESEGYCLTGVKVNIRPGKFKNNVYLRCRTRNGQVIIGDQLKFVKCAETAQEITFPINEPCSDIEVTVWDASEIDNQPIKLLYEYRVPLMRSLSFDMGLIGLRGKLEDKWTKKLEKKSGGQKVNKKVERISRENFQIGGFDKDPWVPAGSELNRLFRYYFPEKSKAQFFSKGWQDENSFVKWFQDIIGKHKTKEVIIIDPYFDDEAVSKFLALAKYSDITYKVMTDIGFRDSNIEDNIINGCKQAEPMLPPNVEVHGLFRKNRGTDQIFHDRFVILFSENQLEQVYLLSNSLSGVAKNHPSVAVPVPDNVSHDIVEYYLKLFNQCEAEGIPKVEVKLLWPQKKDSASTRGKKVSENGVEEFPGFLELTKVLFDSKEIPLDQIGDDYKLQIAEKEQIRCKQFERLGKNIYYYLNYDKDKALKLWCGIANWVVRISDNDREKIFNWLNELDYREALTKVTKSCILESIEREFPIGVQNLKCNNENISIARNSFLPFTNMGEFAKSMLEYHFGRYHSIYSVSMAFEYLLSYNPEEAIDVLTRVIEKAKEKEGTVPTVDLAPCYIVISNCLNELSTKLSADMIRNDFRFLRIGLQAEADVIRALSAAAISSYIVEGQRKLSDYGNEWVEALYYLDCLKEPMEKVHSLAWVAYECQVLRNQKNDGSPLNDTMEHIKKKTVELWPEEFEDNTEFRLIMKKFSGPIEGSYSKDLCDVLKQLVESNKVSAEMVGDYIIKVLKEKISTHLEDGDKYYPPVDSVFTYNVILCFCEISPQKASELEGVLNTLINQSKRVLIRPFIKTRKYEKWKNSIETLCWCGTALLWLDNENNNVKETYLNIYSLLQQYVDDFDDSCGLYNMFKKEGEYVGYLIK